MNTNPTPDALAERLRSYAGTCTGLEPKRIMIAAADSLESLHAKPVVGERVEETGWLIEYGPSSPTAPRYWGGVRGWTYDHMEAVRFSRQVDAQSIAESMDDGVPGNYRLAEHAWASAALQSPPPVVSGEAKHDRGCNSHQDYPCDCATLTASPPVVAREAETFNGYSRATAERALARVHAWCAWSENEYAGEDTNPRMCSDDVRTALALVSTPVYGAGVRVEQALAAGSTDGRSANAAYVPVAALSPPVAQGDEVRSTWPTQDEWEAQSEDERHQFLTKRLQTHYAALSTSALRLSELPEAIDPRDIDSLRYVLNFADTNTRVSSVMKTFTLPDRVTTKDRLERLYATLTKGARDAG